MSLKRKATHGSIANIDTPDNKRRRGPDIIANATETPERTTQQGLEFLEKLKGSKDKQEHLIATHFHVLPDPNDLPEYYQVIQLPIALETIEEKLRRYEYPHMSAIESDLKRMISNAKTFNEKNSEVHNDAEKIRKMISNQFKEINPAYADPNYTAVPTPLPGEIVPNQAVFSRPLPPPTPTPIAAPQQTIERPKRALKLRSPKDPNPREGQTPIAPAAPSVKNEFSGKTFQQAQEQILNELSELKNDDGELIAGSFLQLPSRALKDYYQTIKNPESLNGLKKKAVGKQGHAEPTGVSLMKTWSDFEYQVGYIWRNARTYNEDGSEISVLAGQLERHFNKRVAEAKAVIPDPNRPKVKLNMSTRTPEPAAATNPRITLTVGPKPTPGNVAVDTEALKRQQEMIKSVTHVVGRPNSAAAPDGPMQAPVGLSQSPPLVTNGVKPEVSTPKLPAAEMNGLPNGHSTVGMPPPTIAARPTSGSPFPPAAPSYYSSHATGIFDTRVRPAGKTAADALIQSLDVMAHPSVQDPDKPAYTFRPSENLTQQSFTFSLPHAHNFIRVAPTIKTADLASQNRATKLGVTLQGHKMATVQEQYRRHLDEVDPGRPVYDLPLMEGQINRVEVWMLAGPARGAPKIGTGVEVDFEKYTLFIYRERA